MSIRIKDLTVKNFMSIGNVTQAIDFDRRDLTLVLGENLDLGGDDAGARNGTGKTTMVNALSYALFGQALTNIKRDNLINKTNNKNMLVTVTFECDGTMYHIERGRRPNLLKFFVNNEEQEITDDSQGDSRQTQQDIVKMLGMSHEMFRHIVALNTYTEPFLSLRAADQRSIIEQLLGITLLSEKSEALKEQIKVTKDSILEEEYKIKANVEANNRVKEQIENLQRRQRIWTNQHTTDLEKITKALENLKDVDIDVELGLHAAWEEYNKTKLEYDTLNKEVTRYVKDAEKLLDATEKLQSDITSLEEHKCHACGQKIHDKKQDEIIKVKKKDLKKAKGDLDTVQRHLEEVTSKLDALAFDGKKPAKTYYSKVDEAYNHKSSFENLKHQLENKEKETDPYAEQIEDMSKEALVEITYDRMNELTRLRDHQEFLLKLLTNKDSFIRKRIIDQNLNYLNARLEVYLDKIGLPHTVKFLNDLSVDIQELGRELDFDNLSRGERNRLILSLSWAFRDVWESLYKPVNLLFIDELIDSGLDSSGVEASMAILKKMSRELNKSIWLISHKDELTTRVNNVLHVVKENGFTSYSNYVEAI